MEPRVVNVERKSGIARKVTVEADGKRISFMLENGNLQETSRVRLDGARIWGKEALWISPVAYKQIQRIARAILQEGARR